MVRRAGRKLRDVPSSKCGRLAAPTTHNAVTDCAVTDYAVTERRQTNDVFPPPAGFFSIPAVSTPEERRGDPYSRHERYRDVMKGNRMGNPFEPGRLTR
jgi:hypothetical protein